MKFELLASVLKRALERGATAADGFVMEESEGSASVRMGEVETVTHIMNCESGFITIVKPRAVVAVNEAASANFLRMTRSPRPAGHKSLARGRGEESRCPGTSKLGRYTPGNRAAGLGFRRRNCPSF